MENQRSIQNDSIDTKSKKFCLIVDFGLPVTDMEIPINDFENYFKSQIIKIKLHLQKKNYKSR